MGSKRFAVTSRPAIRTSHLRKEYGSTAAVDSLSLSIDREPIYGFLSPNGTPDTLERRIESNEEPTLENAFLEITTDTTVETSA